MPWIKASQPAEIVQKECAAASVEESPPSSKHMTTFLREELEDSKKAFLACVLLIGFACAPKSTGVCYGNVVLCRGNADMCFQTDM